MSKRVTQLIEEVVRTTDQPGKRVIQQTVEAVSKPSTRYARATQYVIEVLRKNESGTRQQQPVVIVVC